MTWRSELWHKCQKEERAENDKMDKPIENVGASCSERQHADEECHGEKQGRLAIEAKNEVLTKDHGHDSNGRNRHADSCQR